MTDPEDNPTAFLHDEPQRMVEATPKGLLVARQVAGYYIGDPSWAELIIRAYLNPEVAAAELVEEMNA